jgi:hypothetical protein
MNETASTMYAMVGLCSLPLWRKASSPSKTENPAPAMKIPNAASSDQK